MATSLGLAYLSLGFYSFLLILIGTLLNLFCFYIFARLVPNRSNPTIIVFSYLALIELLIPFTWNMNYVVRELIWNVRTPVPPYPKRNLEQISLFICKLISYSAYFSFQCAAWLKTLATFARCVTLHHHWPLRNWLSRPFVIRRVAEAIILIMALMNLPVFIINGRHVIKNDNSTNQSRQQVECYRSSFFQVWEIVHLLFYNFIPFTLMIICNISIIRKVRASRQRMKKSKMRSSSAKTQSSFQRRPSGNSGARLTQTLTLTTILFIVFTAPSAFFYIVWGKSVKQYRDLITMALSNLATTSHVSSFIVYWLTSSDFREAVIGLIRCQPVETVQFVGQTTVERTPIEKKRSIPLVIPSNNGEYQGDVPLIQLAITSPL